MFSIIQVVLIVIGSLFIITGIKNLIKGYNIDKILSILIKSEISKTNEEKGK